MDQSQQVQAGHDPQPAQPLQTPQLKTQKNNSTTKPIVGIIALVIGFLFTFLLIFLQLFSNIFQSSSCETCGFYALVIWGGLAGLGLVFFIIALTKYKKLAIFGIIFVIIFPILINTIRPNLFESWAALSGKQNDSQIKEQMVTLSGVARNYYNENETYEGILSDPQFKNTEDDLNKKDILVKNFIASKDSFAMSTELNSGKSYCVELEKNQEPIYYGGCK